MRLIEDDDTGEMVHDPYCTRCDHACAWRGLVIGAPYCQVCDDHSEAVHVGFGDESCDCGDAHD